MVKKIKVEKKDGYWAIPQLEKAPLTIRDAAEILYVTVNPFNESTVDAPPEFWEKISKITMEGGIDG